MPNDALRNGASVFAEMSSNLSLITLAMMFLMRSVILPMMVLLYSSGSGSPFQNTSIDVPIASGSVMMPIIGSLLPGMVITSFGLGSVTAGMSAKMLRILDST